MKVARYFLSFCFSILTLSFFPSLLSGGVFAVGADCSDGCDDYITSYGWEYYCQSGTKCCTGGGCPSFSCSTAGYTARICNEYWTCCANNYGCTLCNNEISYAQTWGTCDSCGTSSGGGGDTTTYGQFLGRIFTDLDSSGWQNGTGELWSNTATTCSSLKHDSFNISYNSSNIGATWGCNPEAWYYTGNVAIGTNKSVTLVGLPPNYDDCSGVTWTYSTTGTTDNNKSGSGCIASGLTVVKDMNNHLWWQLRPSTKYGSIGGKVRTDFDKDGTLDEVDDGWSDSNSTCASIFLKHDGFTLTAGGGNLISDWGCDTHPSPSYYYSTASAVQTGTRTFTLGGLPAGYSCAAWGYSTTTGSTSGTNSCTTTGLTVNEGSVNSLWWILNKANNSPAVTVTPASINYTAPGAVYPIKVNVEDADMFGQLRIASSTNVGAIRDTSMIEINAYGNPYEGIWPNIDIYGFRRSDGVRSATPVASITVNSTTRAHFQATISAASTYSHFDLVFTNDFWNGVTGRDIWIDDIILTDSAGVKYTLQPEDFSWYQYDIGWSYADANDFMTPSRSPWLLNTPGYLLLGWGGALRLPILWVSPSSLVTGATYGMTIDVYDEPSSSATTRFIPINGVGNTLTGNIWVVPAGSTVNCNVPTTTHPSPTVTVTANPQSLSAPMLSSGSYNVTGIFGAINTVSLSGTGLTPATGTYTNACVNNTSYTVPGWTYNGSLIASNTLNIGLRLVEAKKWIAATGGDIYASNLTLNLPKSCPPPSPSYYMCPTSFTSSYYVLGYNPLASSIFLGSQFPDPNIRYSESNISATNLGTGFASKNKQYFKDTLASLISSLKNKNKITALPPDSNSNFPATKYITALDSGVSSLPDNYTYSVTGGGPGLVFMIIPKSNSKFIINNITTTDPTVRLVILADRDIEIGTKVQGTISGDPKATTPNIQASIITTGNITFVNPSTGTPGTLIIEGPLVSGKDVPAGSGIKLDRDLTPLYNELRPAVFVKFNPLYIQELNKISLADSIPELSGLFVFDFDQQE